MKLFSKLQNRQKTEYVDNDIIAPADAEMIPASQIKDPMFAEEMLGQTIAFRLKDKMVAAPADGTLEVMYPSGHAIAIRLKNGMGILVHVGIDTVKLKGKGFKVFVKQGDIVKAGQKILEVDCNVIREAGFDPTTMLIITEQVNEGERISFIEYGEVKRGQKIN